MTNFIEELKRYIENGDYSRPFEYEGSTLTYEDAQIIYNEIFMCRQYIEDIEQTLQEQRDFIRLLRKENQELRGE